MCLGASVADLFKRRTSLLLLCEMCFNSAGTSPASPLSLSSLLLAHVQGYHYSQRHSSSVSKSAAVLAPPDRACFHSPVAPLSTLCNDNVRYYVVSPVGRTLVWFTWGLITAAANLYETLKLRLFASVFHQEKSVSPLTEETGSLCRYEPS